MLKEYKKEQASGNMNQCSICSNKIHQDEIQYTLKSLEDDVIKVCDYCYQDIGILEKRNGKWIEYIIKNGKEYYLRK